MEKAPLSKVIALCDVLYNWKTIFRIKHVNFKLPKHGPFSQIRDLAGAPVFHYHTGLYYADDAVDCNGLQGPS